MWCVGKSDHLVTIGWGDFVVFRSQVGSSDNVVHVKVVVIVLCHIGDKHMRKLMLNLTHSRKCLRALCPCYVIVTDMPAFCFELEYASPLQSAA